MGHGCHTPSSGPQNWHFNHNQSHSPENCCYDDTDADAVDKNDPEKELDKVDKMKFQHNGKSDRRH